MKNNIHEFITEKIKKICVGDFQTDSNLFNYGLDSVLSVDLLVQIERKFDITFDDEELDLRKINSIRNIAGMVEEKLKQGGTVESIRD